MNHLTFEEIIKFVAIDSLTEESVLLMTKVNQHIVKCDSCLKLVQAFQTLYDEFIRLSTDAEASQQLNAAMLDEMAQEAGIGEEALKAFMEEYQG